MVVFAKAHVSIDKGLADNQVAEDGEFAVDLYYRIVKVTDRRVVKDITADFYTFVDVAG